MATFGEKLKALRERRQFTMRELATAARVPYETIYRLEQGTHKSPRFDVAVKLARALGVRVDYFAAEEDNGSDLEPAVAALGW